MKNLILAFLFMLATMSFRPAEEVNIDCANFASAWCAISEREYGRCFTTEEYNFIWNNAKRMCEEATQ